MRQQDVRWLGKNLGNFIKNKFTPITLFLIKAVSIYTIWQLFYDFVLLPDGRLDEWLSFFSVALSHGLLSIFNFPIESSGRFITMTGKPGVEILNGCNGLDIIGLFASFILAYPGKMKLRFLFLGGGFIILFLSNLFRIAVFVLTDGYYPSIWDHVHTYRSSIFFYPIVLTLWYLWTTMSEENALISTKE